MKIGIKVESVLIAFTAVLCIIVLFNICRKLRSIVPYRVNCWFCNKNLWIKLPLRNCWTCPYCDQYNGFTKDGDYNKPIINNGIICETKNILGRSSPKNGLCKMCNINQQLKVTQLANFIPMNDKNFDEEVEAYRVQLEKAYKLCSPCKKLLERKLCKEKETFLGSKLLQSRTPNLSRNDERSHKKTRNFMYISTVLVTGILMMLICLDFYKHTVKFDKIHILKQGKKLINSLVERLLSILKMKAFWTFPQLEEYSNIFVKHYSFSLNIIEKYFEDHGITNNMMQMILALIGCLIQICRHVFEVNLNYAFTTEILWLIFLTLMLGKQSLIVSEVVTTIMKLLCTATIFMIYATMKEKTSVSVTSSIKSPKKMKNLVNGANGLFPLADDGSSEETDDDVSLSKFGVHNFSDSSNETVYPLNNSLINGRSFTPRSSENLWTKPKNNSTFCVTKNINKMNNINDNIFRKPAFNKYQKLVKDDSDSDLDESISCLSIGSPKKKTGNTNSVFSLRKFNATPSFIAPTVMPLSQRRPLISPSKLGHGTSWVAGGYWGSEGNRQIFNINGSRSSSQSSGFESQASSLNQRNVFSQPPSREESICGEPDGQNILLDRFHNCNVNSFSTLSQNPQNFGSPNSPVYPQMRYDSHVYIPQPRFTAQNHPNSYVSYAQHQFVQNGTFKTPGRSGLIKLPQVNTLPR